MRIENEMLQETRECRPSITEEFKNMNEENKELELESNENAEYEEDGEADSLAGLENNLKESQVVFKDT